MGSAGEWKGYLPIIDVSKLDMQTGERLIQAASKWGFFYVRNQDLGFNPESMNRTFDLSRRFFKSPAKEKAACAIGPDDKGWSSPYAEVLDPDHQKKGDFKEALNFGEFKEGKAQQPLPKSLATNESELSDFMELCRSLCIRILRIFAIGLRVDENDDGMNWFSSRHNPLRGSSGTILRLCYYPSLGAEKSPDPHANAEKDSGIVRAGSHTDFGTMTLLFQQPSQPGLEIQTPHSSSWSPVEVFPPGTEQDALPPIVINIGDLLSYWTNGLLKSTVHRVAIPKERETDRYSIAYFCHPVATTELIPIPSDLVSKAGDGLVADEGRGTKRAMTAKEHLNNKLAQAYGWQT